MRRFGQNLFQWSYAAWMLIWFWGLFLLLYPFFWLIVQKPTWHRHYYLLSRLWAILFYLAIFVPVRVIRPRGLSRSKPAVYCPNHFSYLDIHLLTRTMPSFFIFVGLHDLEKIPLFGYMYRKIHITIDRSSPRSRYATFVKAKEALQRGKNLVIFPEGGIWSEDFPNMAPFKDGPFRIAIEAQVPIVPVSILYNWKMLPLLDIKRLRWHSQRVIYHPPISTEGLSVKDIPALRQQTFELIQAELSKTV
ncbi:MAG: hypothetical protein OHK0053_38500 [Microscillaceae bacterium]